MTLIEAVIGNCIIQACDGDSINPCQTIPIKVIQMAYKEIEHCDDF